MWFIEFVFLCYTEHIKVKVKCEKLSVWKGYDKINWLNIVAAYGCMTQAMNLNMCVCMKNN